MKNDILVKLSKYISKEILKQPERIIDPGSPLISSGLVDSFSLIDLALYVEDEFGIHIDDSELNSSIFDNIDQLSDLIISRS